MQKSEKTRLTRRLLYCVLALMAVAIMILAGCYPGEVESVAELDLVTTLYDKNADFAALTTYFMPDTIIHVCDNPEADRTCPSELKRLYDAQILSRIRQNLENMGFTPATDPQLANVLVAVAASASDYVGYTYYGWWGGYPGYPGWGWYYPYYPVPYEFTTGTIYIGMIDPDNADNVNQQLGAVWLAAINGLLGEGGNPQTRITTTIDQAFEQSSYLGEGK
jgi:hypothetical protein